MVAWFDQLFLHSNMVDSRNVYQWWNIKIEGENGKIIKNKERGHWILYLENKPGETGHRSYKTRGVKSKKYLWIKYHSDGRASFIYNKSNYYSPGRSIDFWLHWNSWSHKINRDDSHLY